MRTRLIRARNAAKLSQESVAKLVGITQSGYSKIERGEAVSEETLAKLSEALGVPADELAVVDDAPAATTTTDAVPVLANAPGWADVLARAKALAPEVDTASWARVERSPALIVGDIPLSAAVVADLGRFVMRHAVILSPQKK